MKKRYPAIGIAAVALGLLLPLPHFEPPAADTKPAVTSTAASTSPACEEDQPCWNCKTDGNKVCGTDNAMLDHRANNYAEAYHLCAIWEKTDDAIDQCRWAAFYAFNPGYNPTARKA